MKKKIITRTTFFKRAKSYQKKLSIDKKVKKISRQLYILSDQHNWSSNNVFWSLIFYKFSYCIK